MRRIKSAIVKNQSTIERPPPDFLSENKTDLRLGVVRPPIDNRELSRIE
jgi:hypothetical protein